MIVKIHKRCIVFYRRILDAFQVTVDNNHPRPDLHIMMRDDWDTLLQKLTSRDYSQPNLNKIDEIEKMLISDDSNTKSLAISIIMKNFNYKEIAFLKDKLVSSEMIRQCTPADFIENLLWIMSKYENPN